MVIIRDEFGYLKAGSLLKYELQLKTSSRKNLGYRTKKATLLFIWKEKLRKKKIPKYSIDWFI